MDGLAGQLSERILPRRAAAKKASKLSAEQLESSPIPSDAESDHGSKRTIAFGEPEKSKGGVKIKYGSKGKTRHSPSKPPRKSKESSRVQKAPAPSQPITRGRPTQRANGNTSRPNSSRSSISSLTSIDDDDSAVASSPERPSIRSPPTIPPETTGSPSKSPAKPKPRRNATNGRTKTSQKRPLSLVSSQQSSSSAEDHSPSRTHPSLRTPNAPSLSQNRLHTLSTLASSRNHIKFPRTPPPDRPHAVPMSIGPSKPYSRVEPTDAMDEDWSLSSLGSLVWVRITELGQIPQDQSSDDIPTMWWPAKVIHTNPLHVSLFGRSPGPNRSEHSHELDITTPSSENVLSMACKGRIRFHEDSYRILPAVSGMLESPRKKQKLDLDGRWQEARDMMLRADEDDNDGLPSVVSSWIPQDDFKPPRDPSPEEIEFAAISSDEEDVATTWRPPKANPMYDLPGELALAREKRTQKDHWPAKLLEFIPPTDPKRKPKYKVYFYDGKTQNLPQDMFFTTTDDGFKTCVLGKDGYNYDLDEEPDIFDSAREVEIDGEPETVERAPTPPPAMPAPPASQFAYDLSIAEQFEYVKPVLEATLRGTYGPARERHEFFMRGAAFRQHVCNSAGTKGDLRHADVEELNSLIWGWVRRKEIRGELGSDTIRNDGSAMDISQGPSLSTPPLPLGQMHPGFDIKPADHVGLSRTSSSLSSISDTEAAHSDAAGPPSSFAVIEAEAENEEEETMDLGADAPLHMPDGREEQIGSLETHASGAAIASGVLSSNEGVKTNHDAINDGENDTSDMVRTTFEELSKLDKSTYCMSVLLREAVLQLLLWRSGERTSHELLSPDEELRLHKIAEEKSRETYWVHDIINMKRAVEGKMIPNQLNTSPEANGRTRVLSTGGTRSRPRKMAS